MGPPAPKPEPQAIDPGDESVISGDVSGVTIQVQPADHPGLPSTAELDALLVPLAQRDGVWQPAPADAPPVPLGTVKGRMSSAAASVISKSVLTYFSERGISGVVSRVVTPEPGKTGPLHVAVMAGTVSSVRTRAVLPDGSEKVDDPRNARIATNSVVQASKEGEPSELLNQQLLEDYLFALNRMPGRQVSSDIAAGDIPGTVTLEYLLQDRRDFIVQLQGSNTGTPENGRWIEQLGIIGTRLLNLDDVLEIRAATNTFDGVYSVDGAWEGRFGEMDYLRWRGFGDWSTYDASDVGIQGNNFTGVTYGAGGALILNVIQMHELFFDLEAGARGWFSSVDPAFGTKGDGTFVTPYGQVNVFRQDRNSVLTGNVGFSWTGTNATTADLTTMGRINPSREWWIIRGDFLYTAFIDELFNPNADTAIHQITGRVGGQWIPGGARATPVSQNIVGGFYTVRGYPQAISVGDNTVCGSLQYDFHVIRALGDSPASEMFGKPFRWTTETGTGMPPSWDLSPHVFFDAGYTSNNGPTVGEIPTATLTAVGIGVTAMIGTDFSVTLDWGIALHSEPALGVQAGDSQVWFVGSLSF